MFGQSYVLGKKQIKISDAGRIIMPHFTYCEPGDEVLFIVAKNMEYFNIFSKNDIFNRLKGLVSKQKEAKSIEEFDLIQVQIDAIQNRCYGIVSVDEQRRVLIPRELRNKILSKSDIFVTGSIALQLPCLSVCQNEEKMFTMDRRNFI